MEIIETGARKGAARPLLLRLALAGLLLTSCASRDDYMATCSGNVACADQMATASNENSAKTAALVFLLPIVALAAIAEASQPAPCYGCVYVVPGRGRR
jgi:hypothetical protein